MSFIYQREKHNLTKDCGLGGGSSQKMIYGWTLGAPSSILGPGDDDDLNHSH